jgi:hypothetical protein
MPDRSAAQARLLVAVTALAAACPVPDATAQIVAGDEAWQALFNGRDLSGWIPKIRGYPTGENFGNTFRVEDGALTVAYDRYDAFDSRFGHIFYEQAFSHYRLRIEYRFIGEQAPAGQDWARRNSGVMLHSQPPYSMGVDQDFPISIEVQFLGGLGDGNQRSTGNLCTPGTNVVYQNQFTSQHCMNSSSDTFDGDQWVWAEVLVLGDERIVHSINDHAVIEYRNPTLGGGSVSGHDPTLLVDGQALTAGHISLQSESHPVQFRRVELLNLKGCMNPASDQFRAWYVEPDPAACD